MTAPEVQVILDAIDDHYGTLLADVPLERIDRDNADNIDTDTHGISEELTRTNIVSATLATADPTPIGTEFDHRIQAIVGVRIEGAHRSEFGHIDPEGIDGEPWDDLREGVRRAIMTEREYPDVPDRSDTNYTWIQELNSNDSSSEYANYYRFDADYAFHGYETLP